MISARRWSVVICIFLILPVGLAAKPTGRRPALVDVTGWEYRWGDSPFDSAGVPVWTREAGASREWSPIDFPSNPPDRNGQTNVWYRAVLPDQSVRDPRIFLYSVNLITEVYLDGQKIYHYGDFDSEGRGEYAGWPWHLIPLPDGYGGKEIYFRVFSDYYDIGLWGDVLLGSGADHIRRIMNRDGIRMVVVVISFLLSLVFLGIYLYRENDRSSLYLALLTMALVFRVIMETHVKQFVIPSPLLSEHIKAASYFVLPIFTTLFLEQVLEGRYRSITRPLWIGVAGLFVATMVGSVTGLVRLADTYFFYDLVTIAVMVVLAVLCVRAAVRGGREARTIAINFLVLGVLALYSILVSNGVFPWSDEINYLLLFQFLMGLVYVLVRRFYDVHARLQEYAGELKGLNLSLEQKVDDRTRQLEQANERLQQEKVTLQIISITDGLTSLYNRTYILDRFETDVGEARRYGQKLSIIMVDLDNFKRVNDSFGHQVGDGVMRIVADVFRENLRDSDLAGRYGGEEFLIVLPQTDCQEAGFVAERIRSQIDATEWPDIDVAVTISGGVSEWHGETADELLKRADLLLYRAKERGRNRIETEVALEQRQPKGADSP